MKTVSVICWASKSPKYALNALKLLFDPAVEGSPYDSTVIESKPKDKVSSQPRFGLRRRLAFR